MTNAETPTIPLNQKKTIRAWALFDWANSAYALVISTAVFPVYYTSVMPAKIEVFGEMVTNSAVYSFAVSFSFILVALFSPLLSGIADYGGKRLFFLKVFTTFGAIACGALYFFTADSWLWFGTGAFIVGTLGFAGGIVFYNSYLPEIVTEDRYDKVSAQGYAYGYVGSVILLLFILVMNEKPAWFNLSDDTYAPRIGFLLVGIWWLGFAQLTFRMMPQDKKGPLPPSIIKRGYGDMVAVFQKVKENVSVRRFLIAFFFYSSGVQTVIYLATIFAKEELGFETGELILIVLILQLVAIFGAYGFAKISDLYGNRFSIGSMLFIWITICILAFFCADKTLFYALAALVGTVMGGIQSLSRSSYAKMLDDSIDDLSSYFSFYDVLYKLSVVSGTFIFGFVELLTNNMRYSVLSLSVFFVIGFVILQGVEFGDNPKRRKRKIVHQ